MRFSFVVSASLAVFPTFSIAYTWKNVHTGGGGGFTPGIVFNPAYKGVAYARTDIGGLYKLNADDTWTPLTDFAGNSNWNRWGIDAVAIDVNAPSVVYVAAGMYTNSWDPNNGTIMRSDNYGQSWSQSPLPFKVGGNMPGRGMGERLAVDPKLNNIVYFGARSGNGLWKSVNSGSTFTKVTSFPNVGNFVATPGDASGYTSDIQGLAFVTFDPTSDRINGATSRIFVGVADVSSSIYVSNDAGATWSAVAGQPTGFLPHKGKLATAEKALYVSYSDGSGPYDGTNGGVWRYDITKSTWTDISPVKSGGFGYGGLSIDAQKPGTIMVASLNNWWPDTIIFRSTDSGATWSRIWDWKSYPDEYFYYSMDNTVAPWVPNVHDINVKTVGWMIEALEIDPFDSNHFLYGTGLSLYGSRNLQDWDTKHNITLAVMANGIEETAVQDLVAPPGGYLISAMGDIGGFQHVSLTTAPQAELPFYVTSNSLDYAGNAPKTIARTGDNMALSIDGGSTWTQPAVGAGQSTGHVAVSANADTLLWSTGSAGVVVSQNSTAFTAVTGLPSGATIASDKKNGTVFYGSSGGSFAVSTNTGTSFTTTTKLGSSSSVAKIIANPTVAGDVWASTDKGLFHSTNYGATFSQISGPTQGYNFALGKSTANTYKYNIFGFFTVNGVTAFFQSKDVGKTWTQISDSAHGFGAASGNPVEASKDTEGLVFIGTNGRGVFYGMP